VKAIPIATVFCVMAFLIGCSGGEGAPSRPQLSAAQKKGCPDVDVAHTVEGDSLVVTVTLRKGRRADDLLIQAERTDGGAVWPFPQPLTTQTDPFPAGHQFVLTACVPPDMALSQCWVFEAQPADE